MNVGPITTGGGGVIAPGGDAAGQLRGAMASPLAVPCGTPVITAPAVAAPVAGSTVKTVRGPAAAVWPMPHRTPAVSKS